MMLRAFVLPLLSLLPAFAMDIDKFTVPTTICGYLPLTKIRDYAVLDLVSLFSKFTTTLVSSPFLTIPKTPIHRTTRRSAIA